MFRRKQVPKIRKINRIQRTKVLNNLKIGRKLVHNTFQKDLQRKYLKTVSILTLVQNSSQNAENYNN